MRELQLWVGSELLKPCYLRVLIMCCDDADGKAWDDIIHMCDGSWQAHEFLVVEAFDQTINVCV